MKTSRFYALLFLLAASILDSHALDSRTWTSVDDGRTITGTLVKTAGVQVVIQSPDGAEIALSPDLLIQSDRDYIFENMGSLQSPLRLDSHTVKTDIAWKHGNSKSWSDSFAYYEHQGYGCLASEDKNWIFVYAGQTNEAVVYCPPINYKNGRKNPFESISHQLSGIGKSKGKIERALAESLVESKLSSAAGYLCHYYKYENKWSTLEVWCIPSEHSIFSSTLSVCIDEIVRKQGYDMLKRNGKHAVYKRAGMDAHMSRMSLYTSSFLARNYIYVQKEFPLVVKYVHKEIQAEDDRVDLDLLMTNRLIISSASNASYKIAELKKKAIEEGDDEVVVGKPGSGWN